MFAIRSCKESKAANEGLRRRTWPFINAKPIGAIQCKRMVTQSKVYCVFLKKSDFLVLLDFLPLCKNYERAGKISDMPTGMCSVAQYVGRTVEVVYLLKIT